MSLEAQAPFQTSYISNLGFGHWFSFIHSSPSLFIYFLIDIFKN